MAKKKKKDAVQMGTISSISIIKNPENESEHAVFTVELSQEGFELKQETPFTTFYETVSADFKKLSFDKFIVPMTKGKL